MFHGGNIVKKVIIIRYDGGVPRDNITVGGEVCGVIKNKDGLPCYLVPSGKSVAELCEVSGSKYRLFRSPAQQVKIQIGNGRFSWVKVEPWAYEIRTVDTGKLDKDNGEKIFESRIFWSQKNVAIIDDPTVEDILGVSKTTPAPIAVLDAKSRQFEDEINALKAEIAELRKLISDSKKKKKADDDILDIKV